MNPSILYEINELDRSNTLKQIPEYNNGTDPKRYVEVILLMTTTVLLIMIIKNKRNEKEE